LRIFSTTYIVNPAYTTSRRPIAYICRTKAADYHHRTSEDCVRSCNRSSRRFFQHTDCSPYWTAKLSRIFQHTDCSPYWTAELSRNFQPFGVLLGIRTEEASQRAQERISAVQREAAEHVLLHPIIKRRFLPPLHLVIQEHFMPHLSCTSYVAPTRTSHVASHATLSSLYVVIIRLHTPSCVIM
jgi:hypothetical protein